MSNSAQVVLKKMMEAGYSEAMAKTLGTAQFPTAKSDFLPWFPWFINVYHIRVYHHFPTQISMGYPPF